MWLVSMVGDEDLKMVFPQALQIIFMLEELIVVIIFESVLSGESVNVLFVGQNAFIETLRERMLRPSLSTTISSNTK